MQNCQFIISTFIAEKFNCSHQNYQSFYHQNSLNAPNTNICNDNWQRVLFSGKSARLPTWYFLKFLSSSITMVTGRKYLKLTQKYFNLFLVSDCTGKIMLQLSDTSFHSGTELTSDTNCYKDPASKSPLLELSSRG